jgi:hypothetical protein
MKRFMAYMKQKKRGGDFGPRPASRCHPAANVATVVRGAGPETPTAVLDAADGGENRAN